MGAMQNKWYVLAIAVPAMLLAYWAISLALADNAIMALVPGSLAGGLFFGAYRVARSPAFAPAPPTRWSDERPPAVARWLRQNSEHADSKRDSIPKG